MMMIDFLYEIADLDLKIRPIKDEQFDDYYNSGYGSWRGDYFDAVLVFNIYGDYVPISTLKPILDKLVSGREFEGYKGGLFSFSRHTTIHFETDSSNYTNHSLYEFLDKDSVVKLKEYIKS